MKNILKLLVTINFILQWVSCTFNPDIPLINCKPSCQNLKSINKKLFYPDSIICTLLVKDLNDKRFNCTAHPDSQELPMPDLQAWTGNCTLLEETFGTKSILLTIDPSVPGSFNGTLIIQDQQSAFTSLPYNIEMQFLEPFDSHPRSSSYWQLYNSDDTSMIKIDYTDKKLLFVFDTTQARQNTTTGIVSRFKLYGDFSISVDFRIRDDMDDGFETGFFVSTSSDTGKWSGDIAGIYLQGAQNRIRLECKSDNLQSFSKEVDLFSGKMGISRDSSRVSFFYHDGNPLQRPLPLTQLSYTSGDTVFIHIKMSVNDRKRPRHSFWNDLYILKGHIVSYPVPPVN
jgi:hypothetical protein